MNHRHNHKSSLRYPTGPTMRIGGETVSVIVARTEYRCEICQATLNRKDAGLVCSENPTHRGFIHQKEAALIQQTQQRNINSLSEIYQIIDGKVVVKNGN